MPAGAGKKTCCTATMAMAGPYVRSAPARRASFVGAALSRATVLPTVIVPQTPLVVRRGTLVVRAPPVPSATQANLRAVWEVVRE